MPTSKDMEEPFLPCLLQESRIEAGYQVLARSLAQVKERSLQAAVTVQKLQNLKFTYTVQSYRYRVL